MREILSSFISWALVGIFLILYRMLVDSSPESLDEGDFDLDC